MATTMIPNAYAQPGAHYGYVPPQPPPSPPLDETSKCSLPSISNLLGLADAGSPTSEHSPSPDAEDTKEAKEEAKPFQIQQQQILQQQQQQQQALAQHQAQQQQHQMNSSPISAPSTRPNSSHYPNPTTASPQSHHHVQHMMKNGLPPTPPMGSEASFDGYASPSNRSVSHVPSAHHAATPTPNYYFESTPPMDTIPTEYPQPPSRPQSSQQHHNPHQHPHMIPRAATMPVQHTYAAQQQAATFSQAQYAAMLGQTTGYYPTLPTHQQQPPQPHVSGLYYQRPLPQSFPPIPVNVALPPSSMPGAHPSHAGAAANPWQHHHYISPSAAAGFPVQSQDRYICQTCNKAFSRPSSLRIHSHSHTGEKPFKCPHTGCGKAFSVRSNMKRHERGCHGFEGGATK